MSTAQPVSSSSRCFPITTDNTKFIYGKQFHIAMLVAASAFLILGIATSAGLFNFLESGSYYFAIGTYGMAALLGTAEAILLSYLCYKSAGPTNQITEGPELRHPCTLESKVAARQLWSARPIPETYTRRYKPLTEAINEEEAVYLKALAAEFASKRCSLIPPLTSIESKTYSNLDGDGQGEWKAHSEHNLRGFLFQVIDDPDFRNDPLDYYITWTNNEQVKKALDIHAHLRPAHGFFGNLFRENTENTAKNEGFYFRQTKAPSPGIAFSM